VDAFRSGHYLTFRVGRQEFALDAACVKAILPVHELVATESPEPAWILGEAALKKEKFPVVDLRVKMNLRPGTYGRNPSIVVVAQDADLVGLLADRVSEIVHARAHDFSAGKLRIGRPRIVLDPAELCKAECHSAAD
jgi:purine-binding chemotaxis protein CheW